MPLAARRTLALVSSLGLVVALGSCTRNATQLLVEVESDVVSADSYRCVRVEVLRFPLEPEREAASLPYPRSESPVPFSLGVVPPDGDASRRVQLVAEIRADGCDVRTPTEPAPHVRRTIRTGFLAEQTIRIPIFLAERCAGVVCGDEESCSPDTGRCEPIPVIDPASPPVAVDAGRPPLDAGSFDAGAIDAGAIDARVSGMDSGPRPDAPLPDAGSLCPTSATMVGMRTTGGTLTSFALAASPIDPSVGLRGVVTSGTGADQGAAEAIGAAPNGSDYTGPPGNLTGPAGVTFTRDGTAGMMTFTLFGSITAYALYGFTTDASVGGRCPSTRCVIGMGSEFAILSGPTNLTLSEITVAPRGRGARGSVTGSAPIASGTTSGGVRPAATGALISWSSGGACTLQHRPDVATAAATLPVPDCTWLDMAALDGGGVGLAWTDSAGAVHTAVTDAALTTLGTATVLDAAQASVEPVLVSASARGYRVTWLDDSAAPLLRSVQLDPTATPLETDCVIGSSDTLEDYQRFQVVRRGPSSAIEWPRGTAYWGTTYTD